MCALIGPKQKQHMEDEDVPEKMIDRPAPVILAPFYALIHIVERKNRCGNGCNFMMSSCIGVIDWLKLSWRDAGLALQSQSFPELVPPGLQTRFISLPANYQPSSVLREVTHISRSVKMKHLQMSAVHIHEDPRGSRVRTESSLWSFFRSHGPPWLV